MRADTHTIFAKPATYSIICAHAVGKNCLAIRCDPGLWQFYIGIMQLPNKDQLDMAL